MKHLDLFSGIGGFALAARRVGWETVGFCEIEPYCQAVLRKHWPGVPVYDDIRSLSADAVGHVDIITGGYPCQPFSLAGKRGGAGDDRHLWPEYLRLIRELRPRWVVGENVAGHITMGLDEVLADLEGLGYAWEAFIIPAVAVDAPHRRDRVWIIGHADVDSESIVSVDAEMAELRSNVSNSDSERRRKEQVSEPGGGNQAEFGNDGEAESLADSASVGRGIGADLGRQREADKKKRDIWRQSQRSGGGFNSSAWLPEPDVGRVAHGIPRTVDRLRALGNAIVPQVAEVIFRGIQAVASSS